MKKNVFRLLAVALVGIAVVTGCKKDDDDPILPPPDNGGGDKTELANGYYVYSGDITALADITDQGLMMSTINENGQVARAALVETFQEVDGDGFYIIKVTNGAVDYIGSSDVDTMPALGEEPVDGIYKGSTNEDSVAYSVAKTGNGVYHIVYDSEIDSVVYAKVDWGVIGAASPGGWGANTPLPFKEADTNKIVWEGTDIEMVNGTFKFRYSNGWKIFFGDVTGTDVRVNTNVGGSLDALTPGGGDITNEVPGVYTFTLTYTFGVGYTVEATKTGDVVIPTYPEAMYVSGDATAYGWAEPATDDQAIMHKCAGGAVSEGIFWKICYLEAGNGFKAAAAAWAEPNIGFAQVDEFDANGVTVSDNGGNMSVAESGMYMIVVNLRDEMTKVSVIAPEVYGIGDAFGGWDAGVAGNLFTVDNTAKTVTSPAAASDATAHRMYVSHAWIPDWWNAEFVVNTTTGDLEYRNDGGDPAAYAITAGQVITVSFDTNTGTIE